MTSQAIWLMAALLVAHCLGDFTPLATPRMHEAKANGGPLLLIAGHAAVHMVLVAAAIVLIVGPAWSVVTMAAAVELVTHFALDATRARLGLRFRALRTPSEDAFWWAFGVDQLSHGLVLVGLAGLVL